MKKKAKAIVVRTAGINCDIESVNALKMVGVQTDLAHTNEIVSGKVKLTNCDILVFPGGFSYGDDIAGGKIWSVHMSKVFKDISTVIDSGRPVMGICNGFQVLTKLGFLPTNKEHKQVASLTFNDSGVFIDKWVKLKVNKSSPCIFTKGLDDVIELPIAHGEGKIIIDDKKVLQNIVAANAVALTYEDNPNGSVLDIAGLCNDKGNCFGLMPHPERYAEPFHHPAWTRKEMRDAKAAGLMIFKNAVKYL
ncbi:Phosphoribosylformylglycinamidine synthase [Elusimicrobium minutum Pei191]|uniref:Phosphoribosylformylglycinamidine synthase n=1 Tax=Elusimicrobium minutum (strain Pei191) TaxID=445932 RepID=B2KCF1_ELUMP|nr:phosphoribosylformylglycinamidine synthase I [Elusimicrobium minutum]ACC98072.1 Phosphoribosylformylglycinamidine synthase [Elusimicrobium minutum Pei191]